MDHLAVLEVIHILNEAVAEEVVPNPVNKSSSEEPILFRDDYLGQFLAKINRLAVVLLFLGEFVFQAGDRVSRDAGIGQAFTGSRLDTGRKFRRGSAIEISWLSEDTDAVPAFKELALIANLLIGNFHQFEVIGCLLAIVTNLGYSSFARAREKRIQSVELVLFPFVPGMIVTFGALRLDA